MGDSDDDENSAVVLHDIEVSEIQRVLMLYGGDAIINHDYNNDSKDLVIYYKDDQTAETYIKFNEITAFGKTYKALRYVIESESNLTINIS